MAHRGSRRRQSTKATGRLLLSAKRVLTASISPTTRRPLIMRGRSPRTLTVPTPVARPSPDSTRRSDRSDQRVWWTPANWNLSRARKTAGAWSVSAMSSSARPLRRGVRRDLDPARQDSRRWVSCPVEEIRIPRAFSNGAARSRSGFRRRARKLPVQMQLKLKVRRGHPATWRITGRRPRPKSRPSDRADSRYWRGGRWAISWSPCRAPTVADEWPAAWIELVGHAPARQGPPG